MEIPINEDHVTTDIDQVLNRWKCDFENLYNGTTSNDFDDIFLENVKKLKHEFESQNPVSYTFENDNPLNQPISLGEVRKAIFKSKNNKAFGVDHIPSEVYKNENSVYLWHTFFNYCFSTGLIPDIWNKGLIKPFPKDTGMDKRLPLNYRGICLTITISKIYSSILNTRLLEYLETHEKLIDEQNGFRKLRSCIDHLYVLTSIIRNRKTQGLSTYVCYIDFAKAFDKVDRDCLFVKLVQAGVTRNMYWGYKNYNKPNTVHNRAVRTFLGVHKFASVPAMSGDMGWSDPINRRKLEIIRFWIKINNMDDDRLTKKVYNWDKVIVQNSWSNDVQNILYDCNLGHLYDSNDPTSIMCKTQILSTVKSKLLSQQKSKWEENVLSQDKLRFYRLFKNSFEVENFVKISLTCSQRSLLCQLRYSTLPLRIETGRYNKIPVHERLCQFCNGNYVESENHFLFQCTLYTSFRQDFYQDVNNIMVNFHTLNNVNKLQIIFSKSSIVRKFAIYLDRCIKQRSSVLYR